MTAKKSIHIRYFLSISGRFEAFSSIFCRELALCKYLSANWFRAESTIRLSQALKLSCHGLLVHKFGEIIWSATMAANGQLWSQREKVFALLRSDKDTEDVFDA